MKYYMFLKSGTSRALDALEQYSKNSSGQRLWVNVETPRSRCVARLSENVAKAAMALGCNESVLYKQCEQTFFELLPIELDAIYYEFIGGEADMEAWLVDCSGIKDILVLKCMDSLGLTIDIAADLSLILNNPERGDGDCEETISCFVDTFYFLKGAFTIRDNVWR